jgi:porin
MAMLLSGPAAAADLGDTIKDGAEMTPEQLRQLDAKVGDKLWDIHYPSFADTLTQDLGGYRSMLASYGFGFMIQDIASLEFDTLHTPKQVPLVSANGGKYQACTRTSGTVCAGGQAYVGENYLLQAGTSFALFYDTSRWGIPDGRIQIGGFYAASNNDNFLKNGWFSLQTLMWHQAMFNKTFELNVGYGQPSLEFIGSSVGGNFASTFGPAASVPAEMGLGLSTASPQVELIWHVTKNIYNQAMVAASFPTDGQLHGLPGNSFFAQAISNPTGFRFTSVPGTREYFIDEVGYKNAASPGVMETWFRAGYIHNFSDFQDLSKLPANPASTAVIHGADAGYALIDRQLWQFDPSSEATAHRGLYAGASAMIGQDNALPLSQSFEGRAYIIGPTSWRPSDMLSFVYTHQTVSHYFADGINQNFGALFDAGAPVPAAAGFSNSYTLSYVAHIRPGLYLDAGLSYTDKPSAEYFKGQGDALEVLLSMTTVW